MDLANRCSHVPSGEVDARDENNEACPLMAISPRLVISDQDDIFLQPTAAENILLLSHDTSVRLVHCRDGYDRGVEQSTVDRLSNHIKDRDIQDIWVNDKFAEADFETWSDDYPRGPVVDLGLLIRDGAIFHVDQDPFGIAELTTPASRRPFSHAVIRKECNNGKQDIWPTVVFPQQPNIVYRLPTLVALLEWLRGECVAFRQICLPSPVISFCSSRGRAIHCVALTECGQLYHWQRDGQPGLPYSRTLAEALSLSSVTDDSNDIRPDHIDMPPISKIVIGLDLGAAISRDGVLNVFSLMPTHGQRDSLVPHLADLDDDTPQHRISPPFVPRLASINQTARTFVDVAAGNNHLVALTSEGQVFTVGNGFQGALGIGKKQFKLDDTDPTCYDWSHQSVEYAEDWQEVLLPDAIGTNSKKVTRIAAGQESTIMLVGACQADPT